MKPLVSLPAPDLCRVVEDTEKLFSDAYVLSSIRDAQKDMQDGDNVGVHLAAFAEHIAPVLLNEGHKALTYSILKTVGGDYSGGSGTLRDLFTLLLMNQDYSALVATIRKHGSVNVLSMLYRHGTPVTMKMLAAALDAQAEKEATQVFIADMGAALLRALLGKDGSKIKMYSELIKKETEVENRSGEEIIDNLIDKLRKRKETKK